MEGWLVRHLVLVAGPDRLMGDDMSQASGHGERRRVAGARPRGVAAGNKRPGAELAAGPFPGGLYWADDSSIWEANLDGTNTQDLLSAWEPTIGVAVDSSHVYWVNTNTDAVRRANPDGSSPQDLVPGQFALATGGVAVDASHLYWTSYAGGPTAGTIRRANLDGSNPQAIVTGQAAPFGIAVDASHLYWTNSGDGTIWRANLDGTNAQSIVQGEGQNSLFAVAVDASHLYWTNRSQGIVKRANLDGTTPQTLLHGQNQPAGTSGRRQLRVLVQPRGPNWRDPPGQPGGRRQPAGLHPQHARPAADGGRPASTAETGVHALPLRLRGGHGRAGGLPGLYAGQHGRDGQRHAGGDAGRPGGVHQERRHLHRDQPRAGPVVHGHACSSPRPAMPLSAPP